MSNKEVKFNQRKTLIHIFCIPDIQRVRAQKCLTCFFNHMKPDPVLSDERHSLSTDFHMSGAHTQCM